MNSHDGIGRTQHGFDTLLCAIERIQLLLDQMAHHIRDIDLAHPFAETSLEAVNIEQAQEELIREALQEANAPERRALKDYPLTERERRSIRGCMKTP